MLCHLFKRVKSSVTDNQTSESHIKTCKREGMIEQIARTPERVCKRERDRGREKEREEQTDRQAGRREKQEASELLSNMNLHFSSFSLLSIFHSNEYPTDKAIRLRDKTLVSEVLFMLGNNIFFTVSLHISYRKKSLIMYSHSSHEAFIRRCTKLAVTADKTLLKTSYGRNVI